MWRLMALLLAVTATAHAETYKWVDEKGVVNYSNTPPPASVKKAETVADRLSTYEAAAPAVQQPYAAQGPSPYQMMAQQEWMQRQRSMAEAQYRNAAYTPTYDDYGYYPYGYCCAASLVRPVRQIRPRVAHHSGVRRF